jgi:hypothetical protein
MFFLITFEKTCVTTYIITKAHNNSPKLAASPIAQLFIFQPRRNKLIGSLIVIVI